MALDFEIDVAASGERDYAVIVRSPSGGEAIATMRLAPEIKVFAARAYDGVTGFVAVCPAAASLPVKFFWLVLASF